MQEFWDAALAFFTGAGWTIVTFLAALVIGIIVIRLIVFFARRVLLKSPLDKTLSNFIITALRFALWLVLLFILASVASIPMTPLVTALGAIALAVGLALKESLANLANGIMLIGTKPFKEGDYVDVAGISGTVKSVHMLTTEIITPDNKRITVPNSKITSESVVNYSGKATRRVEWKFCCSYSSDIDFVKEVILSELNAHEKVLKFPAATARLSEQGESCLTFTARAWTNNADYWDVFFDVNESVFKAFGKKGIDIPFNQLDVHIVKEDGEDVR